MQPFRHAWLLRAAMFWNVLASGQAFHKAMALDAIMLAMQRRACWAAGLVRSLAAVGYCMALSAGVMPVIDIGELRGCIMVHMAQPWQGLADNPRLSPTQGVRLCTHLRWFARPAGCTADLLRVPVPYRALVRFLRLRAGCHALPNVAAGWGGVPRSQRLCPLCGAEYCDERHALLECPDLAVLRAAYGRLFAAHMSMREFVWQADLVRVVQYVNECLGMLAAA